MGEAFLWGPRSVGQRLAVSWFCGSRTQRDRTKKQTLNDRPMGPIKHLCWAECWGFLEPEAQGSSPWSKQCFETEKKSTFY